MKLIRNAAFLFVVALSISANAQTTKTLTPKVNAGSTSPGQIETTQNETKAMGIIGVKGAPATTIQTIDSPVKSSNGKSLKDVKGEKLLPSRAATKTAASHKATTKSLKKA